MEPRLFSHGYLFIERDIGQANMNLQWSHGFSAMDTSRSASTRWVLMGLQWSHGFSAMDTRVATHCGAAASMSFNGATAFQPWIRERLPLGWAADAAFNGATAFQPWILLNLAVSWVAAPALQWSHGFSAMDTAGNQGHRYNIIPVASSIPGFDVPFVL